MKKNIYLGIFASIFVSTSIWAQDLAGTWQQIDDKTGSPKAIIEIRQEENNTYTGKIIKITPRVGYTPREICNNCPTPYTNQPILGMEIVKGLTYIEGSKSYEKGRIIDPLSGKIYNVKMRLNASGKRLAMRAYIGVSALGRSQTWIRLN